MFFQRIRLWGGWASLVAGIAFVVPTAPANAALHGQPTAITITPEFADTVRSGIAARALSEEGVVKVAQAGPARSASPFATATRAQPAPADCEPPPHEPATPCQPSGGQSPGGTQPPGA